MLFVCPLPLVVTADGLRGVFSAYGTLLDALILRDEATGASKGCGIVRFSTAAEARAAIAAGWAHRRRPRGNAARGRELGLLPACQDARSSKPG